jgi:EpsI family protein
MRAPASLWVSVLVVLAIHAGVLLIGHGSSPAGTRFPKRSLSELPWQFEDWQGQAVELDPRIFRMLGAHSSINRVYRNAVGRQVTLHVAMWPTDSVQLPHEPRVCYESAGFTILSTSDYRVADAESGQSNACLMALWRDGQRQYVLFWYQFEDQTVVDRDGMRQAIWHARGKPQWPPVFKVLLQISEPKEDKALETLGSLAKPVFQWLNALQ